MLSRRKEIIVNQNQKKTDMKRIYFTLTLGLLMLSTILSAQTWETLTTGTSYILFDISFPSSQNDVGYAAGMQYTYDAEGVVIKTTDGGDTWTQVLGGTNQDGIEAVCFTSPTTGFVAGWNDYFAKTTDGGATWTTMTVGSDNWYFKDIEFYDANNGIAAAITNSSGNVIYVTSDGGTTWTTATGINQDIQDVCYANANTLYVVGGDEKIAKSTDGGNTWTEIYSGVVTRYFMGVDFDGNFGIVGGEDGKIMSTTDGGSTWQTFATGYENFYGAHVFNSDSAYMGGTDENIYKTTDSGANWGWENDGAGTSHIYKIKATDNSTVFACGSQGVIKRKSLPLTSNFEADEMVVCAGSTVNFTDLSTGATSWNWTFEGGTPATSTDQNPSVVYSAEGTYDVTLEVSNGSATNSTTITDYITVVNGVAQPDTPTGTTLSCAGSDLEYTTNPVSNADSYVWEVTPADAGSMSGSSTTGYFNSAETYSGDYTIKVQAVNACGNGIWSNELLCELNPAPLEYLLSEGGSACEGGEGVEITLSGSEIGVDYYLHFNGDTVAGPIAGTGDVLSFGLFSEDGYYSSTAFNGYCDVFMIGDAIITLDNLPAIAETPVGPESICIEETSDYTVTEVEGAISYVWTIIPEEAGTIEGETTQATASWNSDYEGIAEIAARGENDCGAGPSGPSLEVMVYSEPTPEILGDEVVCQFDNGVYTLEYSEYSNYTWTVDGGDIVDGDGTNEITVYWTADQGSTTYVDVTETKIEGCEAVAETLEVTIDNCVGVNENFADNIEIYPNPAKHHLNVDINNLVYKNLVFKLTDMHGKIVFTENKSVDNNSVKTNIQMEKYPEGLYLFTIESNGNIITSKKIVHLK